MNRRRKSRNPESLSSPPTGSPQSGEPVFLAVGRLRRTHGVKGEIIFEVMTDFPERIRPDLVLLVGEEHRPLTLNSVRPHNQFLLVSFDGYLEIDLAAELTNQVVFITADSLPKLPEGEYYHHQLLGLKVIDEARNTIGRLEDILETGANDVYVVIRPDGTEILIPAIEGSVQSVDLDRQEMTVKLMEWT